jgi:hypothetical protein
MAEELPLICKLITGLIKLLQVPEENPPKKQVF